MYGNLVNVTMPSSAVFLGINGINFAEPNLSKAKVRNPAVNLFERIWPLDLIFETKHGGGRKGDGVILVIWMGWYW